MNAAAEMIAAHRACVAQLHLVPTRGLVEQTVAFARDLATIGGAENAPALYGMAAELAISANALATPHTAQPNPAPATNSAHHTTDALFDMPATARQTKRRKVAA